MITKLLLQEKINNIQDQVDKIRREGDAFKPHVNKQVERIDQIYKEMATKEDLKRLDTKFEGLVASFDGLDAKFEIMNVKLYRINSRLEDHGSMLVKIAEKMGVST